MTQTRLPAVKQRERETPWTEMDGWMSRERERGASFTLFGNNHGGQSCANSGCQMVPVIRRAASLLNVSGRRERKIKSGMWNSGGAA